MCQRVWTPQGRSTCWSSGTALCRSCTVGPQRVSLKDSVHVSRWGSDLQEQLGGQVTVGRRPLGKLTHTHGITVKHLY